LVRTLILVASGLLLLSCRVQAAQAESVDSSEENAYPVVGGPPSPVKDETSRYAAKKHTLNAQGVEEYIEHPDDAESLLAQALEEEQPAEEDELDDKYQPVYEYEETPDEGQDESDGLEEVIKYERAYFIARDHDGDGELSKEEFLRQLNPVDDEQDNEWDSWNASSRGRPAPSRDELMWGKDWTARVSDEQAKDAFDEYDVDKSGKVSWAEWQGIMFHEEQQVPEYRDGLEEVMDPVGDDDIDPAELEEIKKSFGVADTDKDQSISLAELFGYMVKSHDEPLYPDGVMNYTRPSDSELRDAAAQLMKDYDRDRIEGLTLDEWVQGGGW
jgi:Ca2+-binding EF-hand superfamily protein